MTNIDDVIVQLRSYDNERSEQIAALGSQVEAATAKYEGQITEIAELKEQLEAAVSALEEAKATILALTQQVAELKAALEAAQSHLPKVYIGATVGSNDGGLNVTADIRRCYDLSGSGAKEASARAKQGGIVWANYKGAIADSALRSELQALTQLLAAKGQTGLVTYEHESDIKTPIPLNVYHAGYDQLERIIKEFPTLEPIVCLTGFTGDKDPSLWEARSRPTHKRIGFDHYNKGHQLTGEPMSTPEENYGLMVKWAKSKGKPVCIGETGVGDDAVPGAVIKTQAQWYSEHRKYVQDPANNIFAACAFDSGKALLNQTEAKAWYGV